MKKSFTLNILAILFAVTLIACSNDDDNNDNQDDELACTEFSTPVTLNGNDDYTLLLAQKTSSGGFDDTTTHLIQIGAVNSSCEQSKILNLNISTSGSLEGTYPVLDFFDADVNEAHGTVVTQNLTSGSQSMEDIESGSVTITDNGDNNFTVDFEGTLINDEELSFLATIDF